MTFADYVALVEQRQAEQPTWREGQTYFNVLYDHRPDLSELVRATVLDPFHDADIVPDFLVFVAAHWDSV